MVGSSNLSNILLHQPKKQYEFDLLVKDQIANSQIYQFVLDLSFIAFPLAELENEIKDFKVSNNLMEGVSGVAKIPKENVEKVALKLDRHREIKIPLKDTEKSNLNAFFGKGRENKRTKIEKRRAWYEVELIVSKDITAIPHYPKNPDEKTGRVFSVITDDGYEFECKTSGDYSKNFRSANDLKILGRWIKGRLENDGILKPSQMLTQSMLDTYVGLI
jgi:hypothetical protein